MGVAIITNKLTGLTRQVNDGVEFMLQPGEYISGSGQSQQTDQLSEALADEGILLGDAIKWMTDKIGIYQCTVCKAKQELYNEWHRRGKKFIKELISLRR